MCQKNVPALLPFKSLWSLWFLFIFNIIVSKEIYTFIEQGIIKLIKIESKNIIFHNITGLLYFWLNK